MLSIFYLVASYLLGNNMHSKTTEEFQQEILKTIKLKSTPVNIYYQQNVYCNFQTDREALFSVSLNLIQQQIFLFYRDKSQIDNIKEIFPNIQLTKQVDDNVYMYDVSNLGFVEICRAFIDLAEYAEQYFSTRPVVNSRKKEVMSGNYHDTSSNKITAPDNLKNCHFQFLGGGNEVVIHPNANLRNVFLEFLGKDSKVYIGENVSMHGQWCLGVGCTLKIGDKTTSTNPVYITIAEHTTLDIGSDCMFATNNQIRTDDAHPIYDVHTGKRLNVSRDIIIGDRVWVAYGATIFGGTQIGKGSVVGAFSVVKKHFPNNCVLAGVPAKVVRKDIFWERNNVLYTDVDEGKNLTQMTHVNYINPTEELD